jgi:EAL domain-containing protein (putative c-di-GMP-specific phosphodiesterase class I)
LDPHQFNTVRAPWIIIFLKVRSPRLLIRRTVSWLTDNPDQLARLGLCAINLSGLSIGNAKILEQIKHAFANGAVSPHKICFEITKTAAIDRHNEAVHFIS